MTLIMKDGSYTLPSTGPAAPPGKREWNDVPVPSRTLRDSVAPAPRRSAEEEMLEYLYQQLKAQYPGMDETRLREAAKKMLLEIRTQQAQEFQQRFFPQQNVAPLVHPYEQREWKSDPAAAGGVKFAAPPNAEAQKQDMLKRIADQQAEFAKQQARLQATYKQNNPLVGLGQAQPKAPPSKGTPYNPSGDPQPPSSPAPPPAAQPPIHSDGIQPGMTDEQIFQKNQEFKASGAGMGMTRLYRDRDGTVKVAL